jgi:hypothetical protein
MDPSYSAASLQPSHGSPEPEFLKIFKCNSAESAGPGFQFNCCDIFNDKTLNFRLLGHLSGLLKFIQKNLSANKNYSMSEPCFTL